MAFAYVGTGGIVLEGGQSFIVTAKAGVSGECGTVLAVDGSNDVVLALATVGTALKGSFVALHPFAAGAKVRVSRTPVIQGIVSGATPGAPIYVAEGTDSGKLTVIQPSTIGDVKSAVGMTPAADVVAFNCPNPDQQVVA